MISAKEALFEAEEYIEKMKRASGLIEDVEKKIEQKAKEGGFDFVLGVPIYYFEDEFYREDFDNWLEELEDLGYKVNKRLYRTCMGNECDVTVSWRRED